MGADSNYSRFFAPLALQAASQGLTYPLVAMVASRGPGGPLNLAGLAQSNTVMFMLGTLGFGLVTTGMVFGRSLEGYSRFRSVALRIGLAVSALQGVLCLPAVSHLLFGRLIGLPPTILHPAVICLLATVPLQFLFFLRVPFQVALYNAGLTGRASLATILRILVTAALSWLFCLWEITGPVWAVFCLSLPVALEVVLSAHLAGPVLAALKPSEVPAAARRQMFLFNLPLSIGGYLLSLAAIVLGAFIARATEPERMLTAYYLALGLATPVAYGATRTQEVVLAFPPRGPRDRRTLGFAAAAGAVLGLFPLLFTLPGLAELYYVRLQNLDPVDLPLVREAAIALMLYPLCVAVRAQGEGLAGLKRKPMTVITGQAVFMVTVFVTASVALILGVKGNLIGAVGLCLGNLASTGTVRLLIHRPGKNGVPVAPSTTASGQIR